MFARLIKSIDLSVYAAGKWVMVAGLVLLAIALVLSMLHDKMPWMMVGVPWRYLLLLYILGATLAILGFLFRSFCRIVVPFLQYE